MPQQRQFHSILRRLVTRAATISLIASLAFASSALAQPAKLESPRPTAVTGESWLTHLQRSFDETSMGKTGRLGPPPGDATEVMTDATSVAGEGFVRQAAYPASEPENRTVVLHGSDLYRLNCRGCHGETGSGAPPEINSVISPVRATSAAAMMERMKTAGIEISRADAAKMAQQSKALLLDRLHHGGQDMPAFPHLSEAEVNSLVAYLRQLAGVRGGERGQLAVREQRVRVGEHIAKSTCHICHSAAGPNPTPQQLYDGAIPPLSTLALRTTRPEFIRKVTRGAPIAMGTPPELLRGRMPVFYYLSEEEAADVYLYLTGYSPYQGAVLNAAITSPRPERDATQVAFAQPVPGDSAPLAEGAKSQTPTTANDALIAYFPMLAGSLVTLLLGLGVGFTVYEVRRLPARNKGVTVRKDAELDCEDFEAADVEYATAEDVIREFDPEMAT